MIKSDVLKLYNKYGIYYPPKMIFDLYKDDEDIPDSILISLFTPPKPREFIAYGSSEFIDKVEKAITDYIKNEYNK